MREAEIGKLVALDVMAEVAGAEERIACARDLVARYDAAIGQVRDKLSDALAKQLMAEADLADAEAACALSDTGNEEVVLDERRRLGRLRVAVERERDRLEEITFRRTQAKACIAFIER